jgi:predicted porin
MKKRVLMVLALASTIGTAALAQSSVTMYGLLDAGFGRRNNGNYEGGPNTLSTQGNANYSSNWGVKGTEDLGGGLAAIFDLEQTVKPMTGLVGSGFDRNSWVGLSSNDLGQFRLGRQASVVDQVLARYDLNWGANVTSAYGNTSLQAIYDAAYGTRRSDQVQYWTPTIAGFSGELAFIASDDITLKNPKNVYQAGGNYTNGGFSVGAAYESPHADQPGLHANWGVGVKYAFPMVTVSANYYDNAKDTDGHGYGAGFMIPVGSVANAGVQVAHNTLWNSTAWEVFSNYYLSKRTSLYANYGGMNDNAEAQQGVGVPLGLMRKNSYAVGMITRF